MVPQISSEHQSSLLSLSLFASCGAVSFHCYLEQDNGASRFPLWFYFLL